MFLAAGEAADKSNLTNVIIMIVVLVALIAVVFIMPMINNRKQKKQYNDMLADVQVGSTVKTIGGVVGVVTHVDTLGSGLKEFTIETGDEGTKTTMTFDINAIYQVVDPKTHMPVVKDPVKAETKGKKKESEAEAPAAEESEAESATEEVEIEEVATEEKSE